MPPHQVTIKTDKGTTLSTINTLDELKGSSLSGIEEDDQFEGNHLTVVLEKGLNTYRIWDQSYKALKHEHGESKREDPEVDSLIRIVDEALAQYTN